MYDEVLIDSKAEDTKSLIRTLLETEVYQIYFPVKPVIDKELVSPDADSASLHSRLN